MSIELTSTDLQKFNVTDAKIAEYKKAYMSLTIQGIEDKAGYTKVHEARMTIVKKRTEVEKVRKELKADALEYGRRVDGEAKRIVALLEPIEAHLTNEQQKIEDEKARIKAEVEKKEQERIRTRIARLIELGMNYDGRDYFLETFRISQSTIKTATDEDFENSLQEIKEHNEKIAAEKAERERAEREEKARLEKVAADQKAEQERLEKIAKEQKEREDKIKADAEELQKKKIKDRGYRLFTLGLKWDGEQHKLEDINVHHTETTTLSDSEFDSLIDKITPLINKKKKEAEKKRLAEIETAKKAAAEKAKKETEARLKKEAEEKRLAEEKEQKRLAREAALKPDKEKLLLFIVSITKLSSPKVKSKEAKEILKNFIDSLVNETALFEQKVREMK